MTTARLFSELPVSNAVAVISLTESSERLKAKSVLGLGLPASSMPKVDDAAEDDPVYITLSSPA